MTHARCKSSNKFGCRTLTRNFPPLAGDYLCNENSLTYIVDFNAYNGNIKEKPAVSKSQRKSLLFGGHCARYVQTQYGNYLFLKLPYAVRSAAPDKQQKGLKWQVCDGRGMLQSNSRAEGANDWFLIRCYHSLQNAQASLAFHSFNHIFVSAGRFCYFSRDEK